MEITKADLLSLRLELDANINRFEDIYFEQKKSKSKDIDHKQKLQKAQLIHQILKHLELTKQAVKAVEEHLDKEN